MGKVVFKKVTETTQLREGERDFEAFFEIDGEEFWAIGKRKHSEQSYGDCIIVFRLSNQFYPEVVWHSNTSYIANVDLFKNCIKKEMENLPLFNAMIKPREQTTKKNKSVNQNKLKPCPFCGGEPIVVGSAEEYWHIFCAGCNLIVKLLKNNHESAPKKALLEKWNCRGNQND